MSDVGWRIVTALAAISVTSVLTSTTAPDTNRNGGDETGIIVHPSPVSP